MADRPIIPTLFLGLLITTQAHAAPGVGIRWDLCFGDGGVANKTFACNQNVGTRTLAASFVLPAALNGVSSVCTNVDLGSAGGTLPAWWEFVNAGACRQTSLSSTGSPPLASVVCADWSGTLAGSSIIYTTGTFGPNTASIRTIDAVTQQAVANLVAGQEYGAVTLAINNQKSVGAGSCAGCLTPMCIVVRSVQVFTDGQTPAVTLNASINSTDSNFARWQGGATVPQLQGGGCSGAVPGRNSTWGSVKALYR